MELNNKENLDGKNNSKKSNEKKKKYHNKLKVAEEELLRKNNEIDKNVFIVGHLMKENYKVRRWNGGSGLIENPKSRGKRRRIGANDIDEDDDAATTSAGGGGIGGGNDDDKEKKEKDNDSKDGVEVKDDEKSNQRPSKTQEENNEEDKDKDEKNNDIKKDEETKEDEIKIYGVTSVSGTNIPKTTPKPSKKKFPTCSVACGGNRPVVIKRSPTTAQAYTSTSFEQGKPIPPGCSYKCTMMPERTPSGKSFLETGEINRCSVSCSGMYSPNPSKSHSSCASWKKKSYPIVGPPREPSLKPEAEPEAAPSRVSVGVGVGDEEKVEVEIKTEGEEKLEVEEGEALAEGELKVEETGSEKGSKISRVSGVSFKAEGEEEKKVSKISFAEGEEVSRKSVALVGSAAELGEEGEVKEKVKGEEKEEVEGKEKEEVEGEEKEEVVGEEGVETEEVIEGEGVEGEEGVAAEEGIEPQEEVETEEGVEGEGLVEEGEEKAKPTKVESETAEAEPAELEQAQEAALDVVEEEGGGEPETAVEEPALPEIEEAQAAPIVTPEAAQPITEAVSKTEAPPAAAAPVTAETLAAAPVAAVPAPVAAPSALPVTASLAAPSKASTVPVVATRLPPTAPSVAIPTKGLSLTAPGASVSAQGVSRVPPQPPPPGAVSAVGAPSLVPIVTPSGVVVPRVTPSGVPRVSVTAEGIPIAGVSKLSTIEGVPRASGIPSTAEVAAVPSGIPVTAGGVPLTVGGIPVLVERLPYQPGGVPVTVNGRPVTAGGLPVLVGEEPEEEEEEKEDPDKVDFDVAKYAQRVYDDDDKNCACQKRHEKVRTLLKKTFDGHICCFSKPECLVIHGCVSIHNVKGKMKVGISNCNRPTDGVKTCRNDPCLFPHGQTFTVAAAKAGKAKKGKKVSIVPSEPEMVPEAEASEVNVELEEPEEEIPGEVVCIHHPLRLLVNGCCNAHKEQTADYGYPQRVMPFHIDSGFQHDAVFSNPTVGNSSYKVSWSSSEIALNQAQASPVSKVSSFSKDSFAIDESSSHCSIQRIYGRTTLNISSDIKSESLNYSRACDETQTSKPALLTCRTNTDISPMYSNEISNLYYSVYNEDYNVVRDINFGLIEQLKHVSTQYVKSKKYICKHNPECPIVPKCFRFRESYHLLTEKELRCLHEPSCIQIPVCSVPSYRKCISKITTSCQCGKRNSSSPCRVS